MVKNLFFLTVLMLLSSTAGAEENVSDTENSGGAEFSVEVKSDKFVLYNFSDELQKAVENCSAYKEDFAAANPDIQKWSSMFGGAALYADIDVLGKEQQKCHFIVSVGIEGYGGTKYDCYAEKSQMDSLLAAMKDRSTKPVTKEITTKGDGENMGGVTTITDSLFNVVWAEVSEDACQIHEEEPDAEKQDKVFNIDNFSADFINNLYQCKPYSESKTFMILTETVDIVGRENNKCHLHYDWFDLYVPDELLPNIQSFSDVRSLLQNRDITVYNPDYKYGELLYGLAQCLENTDHTAGLLRTTKNDVVITEGLTFKKNKGGCEVKLLNQLNIAGEERDYSVNCSLSADDLNEVLQTYKDLLQKKDVSQQEMDKADAEIMFQMQRSGLCRKPKM